MSKEVKRTSNLKQTTTPKSAINIPEKYKDAIFVGILTLLVIIFFREAIFGGSFWGANDNLNPASFITYRDQPGEYPQWQPYVFGGMPGMAALMEAATRHWDVTMYVVVGVTKFVRALFDSEAARAACWYVILIAGVYMLMRTHKQDRFIAFYTAVATTFCTGVVIWIIIGHNAKPMAFMMWPYVFIMIERLKRKFSLINIALTALVMHVMLESGHVQMMFYGACVVGIYLILEIITSVVKKENVANVLRAVGVLVLASGFAFLMSADKYLSVLEYTPYSTRGTAPISKQKNNEKDATGKDYEYATMWSFSPDEIIDLFVPNYHGFGKVPYSGELTGGKETKIMTYWGQKPFEDAAPYMGALVIFLALFGAIRYFKTNTFVQAMTLASILGLFLSFGYTFPLIFDLFFYHFPKFSSFRAPSMALAIMHATIPILAGFGIAGIMQMREEYTSYKTLNKIHKTPLNVFFAAIGIFVIIGIIFSAIFESSYVQEVANSNTLKSYGEQVASTLSTFILENTVSDWTVIGLICVFGATLVFLFISKKINFTPFMLAMLVLLVFDLWRVSYRPMEVVDKSIEKEPFQKTDVINFILNDKDLTKERFRICDLSNPVTNSDAYFMIENVNGYHPAKLRVYQDVLDVCNQGSTSNVTSPFLWNIFNAKYIISPQNMGVRPIFQSQQTGAFVYYNPAYCKRAFFVDSVKIAKPLEILEHLNKADFNPKTLAYIEKSLDKEIVPSRAFELENAELNAALLARQDSVMQANGAEIERRQTQPDAFKPKADIVEYENEYILINTETKAQHLLVLSEIYYPVCWKAYIDGTETEIHKTNYALRSIVVPAGNHKIELKYYSKNFVLGRTLSTATNIILLLAIAGGLIMGIMKKRKQ